MNQILIQGIGYVALLFAILSFQKNKRGIILFYQIISQTLFFAHYSLLHAWTGAAINVICTLRAIIFYQKDRKTWAQNVVWVYAFMGAFILTALVTWTNYYGLLAIIATLGDTFALWKGSTKSMRFFMLMPRPLWLLYNLLVGSYAGMTTEVFVFLSVLIGILRFDILNTNSRVPRKVVGSKRNL
ncbi:YgjV family protein [Ktedonobacteria bacterium brp13]|nr:YgjV family protein [Ktedonobacteria bacterium brp13]